MISCLSSIKLDSSKLAYSIANFFRVISFFVKVPVLSVNMNYILPNSSGIVLFLGIVPGIDLSDFIRYEKYIFPISKFVLKL